MLKWIVGLPRLDVMAPRVTLPESAQHRIAPKMAPPPPLFGCVVNLEDARIAEPTSPCPFPCCLPWVPCPALIQLYNFVWDRFRMVRSDYNMQGFNPVVGLVSEASIVAHERMAR